jgi:peptide-methionine (R)-S-oxide reductase
MYHCGYCGVALFSSKHKFDSGSGWPSFDRPNDSSKIKLSEKHFYDIRYHEVLCALCDSHLGDVFDDGPQETTGQRFCINSLALDFKDKNEQ